MADVPPRPANACRYCAAPLDDPKLLFCPKPARCKDANSRSNRPANRDARAAVLAEHLDRPSLLDRDRIENDPDQIGLF